jgi:hypothetical protein
MWKLKLFYMLQLTEQWRRETMELHVTNLKKSEHALAERMRSAVSNTRVKLLICSSFLVSPYEGRHISQVTARTWCSVSEAGHCNWTAADCHQVACRRRDLKTPETRTQNHNVFHDYCTQTELFLSRVSILMSLYVKSGYETGPCH